MTRTGEILQHLRRTGSITPLQALEKYHVYRLSSVIHRLRKEGWKIKTVMVKAPYSDVEFAKYIME